MKTILKGKRNAEKGLKYKFILFVILFLLPTNKQSFSQISIVSTNYPIENIRLIKKNFRHGEAKAVKADLLQRLLIGEWDSIPPDGVLFKKNGTFQVVNFEHDRKVEYRGVWKARDNAVEFKVDGSNEWQKCRITYINYTVCDKKCDGLTYRELFEIGFEEVYFKTRWIEAMFLNGGISISFN